jgi:hypothetical protein
LNPKAACLKRREEEKTEDLNTVSITLAPHNSYGNLNTNENLHALNSNGQQSNLIVAGTSATSSNVDGWWLTVI